MTPTKPNCTLPECPNRDAESEGKWAGFFKNIILFVVALAGFTVWAMAQEKRITTIEVETKAIVSREAETREEFRQDLKDIKAKLDRIAEAKR